MENPANKVRVPGHKGPHPEEYHKEVFRRLRDATLDCRKTEECRELLIQELRSLAKEILEKGSDLNQLLTRSG